MCGIRISLPRLCHLTWCLSKSAGTPSPWSWTQGPACRSWPGSCSSGPSPACPSRRRTSCCAATPGSFPRSRVGPKSAFALATGRQSFPFT
uniref:Putative secreted protein n=1 Tax=Ixodes ricinus TaxID=34613 RepID=A0A6B0UBK6_IXORI